MKLSDKSNLSAMAKQYKVPRSQICFSYTDTNYLLSSISMTFQFKQQARDFYVSEQLPFELDGKGDALFVYFEKRNLTTHDVIDHLRERFNISRKTLGIAGLKDKRAVAKQRISIYDSALKKLGGERVFVDALSEIVAILEVDRHAAPIGLSTPIVNTFHIRLRSEQKLGQTQKAKAIEIVENLLDQGYPNLFGEQRFGINGKNRKMGLDIMQGKLKSNIKLTRGETIFKLQSFSSKIFNDYAKKRIKKKLQLMDGDILTRTEKGQQVYGIYHQTKQLLHYVQVKGGEQFFFVPQITDQTIAPDPERMMLTGPVPGFNTPLADKKAGERESNFLQQHHLNPTSMARFQEYRVFGLRRPIRVYPLRTNVRFQRDDLLIDFTLPAGSYASIIVDKLGAALR